MTQETSIRPARLADSDLVIRLIYMTMGVEADWLFGLKKELSAEQVMKNLFLRRGNRMSYDLAYLAEQGGQVLGLLLAYPGKLLTRLNWMTALPLLKGYGLADTLRLIRMQSAYGNLKEAEGDEFYISNVAVFPDFQGKGIGSRLMDYAEGLARSSGLMKCSLIVSYGHENAYRLYQHLGYDLVRSYPIQHPKVAEGSGGYHRMVKTLKPFLASAHDI